MELANQQVCAGGGRRQVAGSATKVVMNESLTITLLAE